jgi:hypothetical protein
MAGAVGAAARGAIEAGERGGGQPQVDLAGTQSMEGGRCSGRGMGPCGFSPGEGGGRGEASPTLLNPAERVFAEVRWWVEGRRYERIEAKKAAVEEVPRRLEAEGNTIS